MKKLIGLITTILLSTAVFSQDPNFHIYLCFGQSNMEGQGTIEAQDKNADSRFQVFQALDCSNLGRTKNNWYKAVPPLCNCWSGLSPADYFGHTMVENLPENVKIGVINVAIGGCDIRLFDKDIYADYDSTYTDSWFTNKVKAYDWNPYQYLIDLAKQAQQDGVIKGILLHQGETNTGNQQWPNYVNKIYTDMMNDLALNPDSIPILAGEVLQASGSCCSSMNNIIKKLPNTIPNAHVISSEGCEGKDNAHFNAEGYRILGSRYAETMLSIMGIELIENSVALTEVPMFGLNAIYPNPLSEAATITFNVAEKTHVSIAVYDLQGAEVAILANGTFSSGEHQVEFCNDQLPSGMYFCTMKAKGFIDTQKLIIKN